MINRDKYVKNTTIREYAFYGDKANVDKLLGEGADVNEAIIGYALADKKNDVNDLLNYSVYKIAGKNAAVYGYALANNEKEVNALLLDSEVSKNNAICGYIDGKHQGEVEALLEKSQTVNVSLKNHQYEKQQSRHEKQKSKNIIYTVLVALVGIFIPLASIPLPRWFKLKSKAKDPIQKLVISRDNYLEVKKKRENFRGEEQKIIDYDKPKKLLISKKDDPQLVYLVDNEQLDRFNIFSNNGQDYLNTNKEKIQNKIKASKAESKEIMRRLYTKMKKKPLPQEDQIKEIEKEISEKQKEVSDMEEIIKKRENQFNEKVKELKEERRRELDKLKEERVRELDKLNEYVRIVSDEQKKENEKIREKLNLIKSLMQQSSHKEDARPYQNNR